MIRVAFVSADGTGGRGGIARVAAYLCDGLAEVDPSIAFLPWRTQLSARPVLKHVTTAFALARFAWAARRRRFDLVHLNVSRNGSTWRKLVFATVAQWFGLPVVVHLHGSGFDNYWRDLPPRLRDLAARFFRSADHVVALSAGWRVFLIAEMGLSSERVTVISNGVALPGLSQPRDPAAEPTILFLGEVGPRKGVDVLIGALGQLGTEFGAWRAHLVGQGQLEWARSLAREAGIADRLSLSGWVPPQAAAAILASADLLVLPSRAENQPVAVIEAMAHGLPVIGSNVGAIAEQVVDGQTGLIVPPGDVVALAKALAALLADPQRRQAMGRAGRMRAEANYSIQACAKSFSEVYHRLVVSRV